MKKVLMILLCCMVLLPCVIASAEAGTVAVVDMAGLLSVNEEYRLENKSLMLEDDTAVYILTANALNGKTPDEFVDEYFQSSAASSTVVFFISMEERDWLVVAYGRAADLISDREIEAMGVEVVPSLSAGEYYEAFDLWLDILPRYMQSGSAYSAGSLAVALLIGAAVGGIVILIMRSGMKTAKQQSSASDYLKQGSFRLSIKQDWFLYSRVTKTPRPKNNSSSGGGGSRRSGGGKF